MKKNLAAIIALVFIALTGWAQQLNVIPQPVKVVMGKGVYSGGKVSTELCQSMGHADGYVMSISKKGISIKAQNETGMQYAMTTLDQLREQHGNNLPCMTIEDWPQYEWRGLMLDCSRHFYTLEYLKKQVDMLARYKMNRLHLHLTDDQGWRVEIKRYPELTQQGAWREFNQQDSICINKYNGTEFELDRRFIIHHEGKTLYGGYYTQEQLRDLVAYAAERHVEIIPEIDMPGHTQAITSLYPQFTATGESKWGTVFSFPLSPAKEEVYEFLQNVLDEVMEIFPSRYIHIGADEVEKDTWKKSDACKALMEREGFKTYEALQSYFVNRIHKYLTSKGREMICWDDALEGGDYKSPEGNGPLDSSVDIMYWRYWVGGVAQKATEQNHHVIFTPGAPMYIAHDGPVYDIYHYDGMDKVPAELHHLVRGGQMSLWAEEMSNFRRAESRIYPRLLAMSELLWTPAEQRNWKSFKQRMEPQKSWLEKHDVMVAKTLSTLNAMMKTDLENRQILVDFDSEYADPDIRYTFDGSVPTMSSARYDDMPVSITSPVEMTAAIMIDGVAQTPMFKRQLEYHKAVGAKVEYTTRRWYESYKAAEMATFTDGKRGAYDSYGDGNWQGFLSSFEVIVDLGDVMELHDFSMRFMQDAGPGLFMPGSVTINLSADGRNYGDDIVIGNDIPKDQKGVILKDFTTKLSGSARYMKVNVANVSGGFIFADEIVVH